MFCDIMFFALLFGNYSFMSSTAARFASALAFASVSAFAFLLRATKPAVVVLAAPPMLGVSCVGAVGLPPLRRRRRTFAPLRRPRPVLGGGGVLAVEQLTRHRAYVVVRHRVHRPRRPNQTQNMRIIVLR